MGGDERRGRKQLTTENTECTEGRAELDDVAATGSGAIFRDIGVTRLSADGRS
jgi:hypothetical protein